MSFHDFDKTQRIDIDEWKKADEYLDEQKHQQRQRSLGAFLTAWAFVMLGLLVFFYAFK